MLKELTAARPPETADLIVAHGYLVTMDAKRRVFSDGAVAIRGRRIVGVGTSAAILSEFTAPRVLDARGGVVHPGFVECHTHVTYHLARGAFGDTISYAELGPTTELAFVNALTDEDEHASTLLACWEMISNGATCFVEAGTAYSPDAVAAAAQTLGMRGLVGDPFLWDAEDTPGGFNAYRLERAPADTDRCMRLLGGQLRRNSDPDVLVRGHVAIAGMGTATDELERAAKAAADAAGVILNQHQSYYAVDAGTDDRRHGKLALLHLDEIGLLDRNCLFAHVNVIRDPEVDPLIRSGLSIAWCPAGSMLWGVGGTFRGRHAELYRRGGTRTILTAEDALTMATINGARAAGLEHEIGSLEIGKRADLVIRRNDVPEAFPLTDPVMQLVYSTGSKTVNTVLIDGHIVMQDRVPTGMDPSLILETTQSATRRVFRGR